MQKKFAVIGAGRVGSAIAEALFYRGWKCVAVISRQPEPAQQLASRIDVTVWGDRLNLLPEKFSHLFICTPDDVLPEIRNQLSKLPRRWDNIFIAHASGTHNSLILQSLVERGAIVASLHPAMSFTGAEDEWQKLTGGWFALEGNEVAQKTGREVLAALEAKYILLLPEQKTLYHIACVLAANYLVTLHAQAEMLLANIFGKVDAAAGRTLLQNLSHTVLENLKTNSTAAALTGPIARGDAVVIESHLRLLAERFPQMLPLYRELGKTTLELARKGGGLVNEVDQRISALLT